MTSIIDRLRAAQGPDRDLGREILLACGWRKTCVGHFYGPLYNWSGPNGEHFKDDDFASHDPTGNVDAAIALVPAELDWEVRAAPHRYGAIARVVSMETTARFEAATPASALTGAALLARGIG